MSTTAELLESSRAELARIESEQHTKVLAATAAFEADPNEKTAAKLSDIERISAQLIKRASAVVADLEAKLLAESRADLEAERDKLTAELDAAARDGSILAAFVENGLEKHRIELRMKAEIERVGKIQSRRLELMEQLEPSKDADAYRNRQMSACGSIFPSAGEIERAIRSAVLSAMTSEAQSEKAKKLEELESIRETEPLRYNAILRVMNGVAA